MYSKKTKFVSLLLSFVMILTIVNLRPQNSYAESYSTSGILGGRFRWEIDSNKTFTIQGEGYITPLDFDDDEGNIYRAISEAEKVIIKEGIKNIPENFLCETQMKTLILPDTLEEIAPYGINSYYLKSLHIPKNLHKLGTNAISCPNLKLISVASDNPYFTTVAGVLYNKSKNILVKYPAAMDLSTYYIPESVNKIATGAFYECKLNKIIMPDTVEQIGHYAFTRSGNLTYIRLSNNLEGISGLAFGDCEKLQSIELPDSVEYIKGEAFYSCDNLSFVKLSKNITEIGEQAFSSCTSLKKIDLPSTLLTLGEHAFAFSGITEIKIPNNVTSISSSTFYNCESLKAVYLPNNLEQIKNHAFCYCTALTYIDIPDSVSEIQEAAFSSCENLVSVHLPENISKIHPHTFNQCEKLSNVNLPASITEIGEGAFLGCISIKTITLPRNITIIGESAFSGCRNFESVFIPKSVTKIERGAFNATGLKNVQYDGTTEQWNAISISSYNTRLLNAYKGYTVNFYTNDGSSDVYLTQMVSYGDYITAPEKPVRDGYIFTGWYSNPNCTGEPYIISTGVSYRKPNSNLSLYAGWKNDELIKWGEDTFSFGNSSRFWIKKNDHNDYIINDEYFDILTSGLNPFQKFQMNKRRNASFGGSCYGISVAMAMFAQGLMTPEFVQKGAKTVSDLQYPVNNVNVASMINYYQLSQSLPDIQKKLDNQYALGTAELSNRLIDALLNIEDTRTPIVVGYNFKNDGEWNWNGHAILAYKIENLGDCYKIHIADPNDLAYPDRFSMPDENGDLPIVIGSEPRYMYISNSDVIYDDAEEGLYSFSNGNLRLYCVLDDTSLYQPINIQEKTTKQCLPAQYSYNLQRLSTDNTEENAEIMVNFKEFSVATQKGVSTIGNDGIIGDLEILDDKSIMSSNVSVYGVPVDTEYSITPISENSQGYETMLNINNAESSFMSAKSTDIATFNFIVDKTIKIESEHIGEKNISYSSQNNSSLLGGVDVNANVATLSLTVLDNGKYMVDASSTLKDTVVTVTDIDGYTTSALITDDVTKFTFTYTNTEDGAFIVLDGTNDNEQIRKKNTVVFVSNGGSAVDTLTEIEYGAIIQEPTSPIYEGFVFDGWYKDEFFIEKWDFENDVVTENINLYAKWSEDTSYYHIVSFNDGTTISQIVVPNGYVLSEADLPSAPTEDGYYYAWDISAEGITADTEIMLTKKPVETMFDITYVSVDYDNQTANIAIQYETSLSENLTAELKIEGENNTEIASYSNAVLCAESETSFVVPLDETGKIYTYNLVCCDIDGNELVKYSGELYAEKEVLTTDEYIYSVVDDEVAIISYVGNNQIVTIPTEIDGKTVSTILSEAFSSTQITEIIISESITDIESNAFGNSTNLSKIKVSESNSAYCSQDGILYSKDKKELIQYAPAKSETSFTVPNFVERIGNGAFYGSILNTIILSASTIDVSYETFAGSANLENIEVSGDSTTYSSVNGVLFDKTASELILYPSGRTDDYYFVPDGTKNIKSGAFCDGEITYLAIPSSLEMFEELCFNEFWFVYILYCGDEDSWNNIVIGANEDSEYWDIRYNYNPEFRIDAEIESAVDDGNVVSVGLNYNYSYQPHSLYAAIYDKDGRLIDIKNDIFYEWDEPENLTFDFNYGENVVPYKVKVFFFESINTIKPLRTALETVITKSE